MALPPGEFDRRHLTFRGLDPWWPKEPRCHEAGPYPYLHAGDYDRNPPRRCQAGDIPSLLGCRPVEVPPPDGLQVQHLVLYLASDLPVDPHRMAWEIESALVRYPDLGPALWNEA